MADYGILSLVPTLVVLILAISLRHTITALIAGVFVGLLLLDYQTAIPALATTALTTLENETVRWVILVCGLLGSLIAILAASGAATAFGDLFGRYIKNKKQSMLATAGLGVAIFVDDYLNALAVSSSMRQITERYRVSKQMLAYIVDSTSAPISLIIPISTWAIFFSSLIEDNGLAPAGEGIYVYIQAIPYMLYAWVAILLVFLVCMGIVPVIGPMKKAEELAATEILEPEPPKDPAKKSKANIWSFMVPMAVLVFFTIWFDNDIFQGVIVALFVTVPFLLFQKVMKMEELLGASLDGFLHMIHPLAIVFGGFMLKEVNDRLGLTYFAIENITPFMTAATFPVLCFLLMGALAFATSSSWGIFVVAFPIVVPIGQALGADIPLVLGALLSASVFGSHACFYSDATVLVAKGSGCSPFEHAITQIPYALIGATVSCILFALIAVF